jgi:hypothetical protein
LVAGTTAKVIPLPKQRPGHGIEREAVLAAQCNPPYSPEVVTTICFSKAMFDTYQVMVGESMSINTKFIHNKLMVQKLSPKS